MHPLICQDLINFDASTTNQVEDVYQLLESVADIRYPTVLAIHNAHCLTEAAGQLLCRIIADDPDNLVLILISDHVAQIFPGLLSCARVKI